MKGKESLVITAAAAQSFCVIGPQFLPRVVSVISHDLRYSVTR